MRSDSPFDESRTVPSSTRDARHPVSTPSPSFGGLVRYCPTCGILFINGHCKYIYPSPSRSMDLSFLPNQADVQDRAPAPDIETEPLLAAVRPLSHPTLALLLDSDTV